jgi:hypothetical protein
VIDRSIPKVFIDTNMLKWGLLSDSKILQKQPKETVLLLKEVPAIRTIIELARKKKITLYENMENTIEKMCTTNFRQNREIGNLLNGVKIEYVVPPYYHARILGGLGLNKQQLSNIRDFSFKNCKIRRFVEIKSTLGNNKDADAYHIYSAEKAEMDYFLTMDKRLVNSARNQRVIKFIVEILYPSELVQKLETLPQT